MQILCKLACFNAHTVGCLQKVELEVPEKLQFVFTVSLSREQLTVWDESEGVVRGGCQLVCPELATGSQLSIRWDR